MEHIIQAIPVEEIQKRFERARREIIEIAESTDMQLHITPEQKKYFRKLGVLLAYGGLIFDEAQREELTPILNAEIEAAKERYRQSRGRRKQ